MRINRSVMLLKKPTHKTHTHTHTHTHTQNTQEMRCIGWMYCEFQKFNFDISRIHVLGVPLRHIYGDLLARKCRVLIRSMKRKRVSWRKLHSKRPRYSVYLDLLVKNDIY